MRNTFYQSASLAHLPLPALRAIERGMAKGVVPPPGHSPVTDLGGEPLVCGARYRHGILYCWVVEVEPLPVGFRVAIVIAASGGFFREELDLESGEAAPLIWCGGTDLN